MQNDFHIPHKMAGGIDKPPQPPEEPSRETPGHIDSPNEKPPYEQPPITEPPREEPAHEDPTIKDPPAINLSQKIFFN